MPQFKNPKLQCIDRTNKVFLDDIVGQKNAKEEARKFLLLLRQRSLAKMYGVDIPNILFYGEAGTGKTLTVQAMACEAENIYDTEFVSINLQDLGTCWVNETANNFKRAMETIENIVSTPQAQIKYFVVFLDEFDSVGGQRGRSSTGEDDKLVNAINSYIDGDRKFYGVSFIAATNFYDIIDPSQKSRFPVHIKYHTFTKKNEIAELLRVHINRAKRKSDQQLFSKIFYSKLAEKLKGHISGRDIKGIVDRAIQHRLDQVIRSNKYNVLKQHDYLISMADFNYVINKYNLERKAKPGIGYLNG